MQQQRGTVVYMACKSEAGRLAWAAGLGTWGVQLGPRVGDLHPAPAAALGCELPVRKRGM